MTTEALHLYLLPSEHIDCDHPSLVQQAKRLTEHTDDLHEKVRRLFHFVRDEIRHSGDHRLNPVTCKASDVLLHGTGYCYAKSHLLAALLRAVGIPAGLCYQRLAVHDEGPPYCLHGLNAVYLPELGWYRLDARGNKPGVSAQFDPPPEALAFPVRPPHEWDMPGIWSEPLPIVVDTLRRCLNHEDVLRNLPDV